MSRGSGSASSPPATGGIPRPVWSPDGRKIAFISDRDGTTQIHVMWLDTREVAQLTHLQTAPSGLTWSPDGKELAFTSFIPDEKPILSVKLPARPRGAKWADPAVLIDRLSWRSDGRGPLPKGSSHIFVVDAELGGTPRQVTSGDYSHRRPRMVGRRPEDLFLGHPQARRRVPRRRLRDLRRRPRHARGPGPDRSKGAGSRSGRFPRRPLRSPTPGTTTGNYTSHLSSLYLMDADGGGKRTPRRRPAEFAVERHLGRRRLRGLLPDGGTRRVERSTSSPLAGKAGRVTSGVHYLTGLQRGEDGPGRGGRVDLPRAGGPRDLRAGPASEVPEARRRQRRRPGRDQAGRGRGALVQVD